MNAPVDVLEMIRASMVHTVPFAKHVGIELTEVGEGTATATLEQSPETTNHMRSVHAGALFTLAETAAGGAVAGAFAPFMLGMKAFPTEMSIELDKPVRGRCLASASITRDLSKLTVKLNEDRVISFDADVVVKDEDNIAVASFRSSWRVRLR